MKHTFGSYIRERRGAAEAPEGGRPLSLRRVAAEVGVEPSYLSKVERDVQPPPSEETIKRLAAVLGEDPDLLLALAGKISTDLKEVIRSRPQLFGQLLRELKNHPDHAVLRLVREVRDGEW